MQEKSGSEPQLSSNSPARQLIASLARASHEIAGAFDEAAEDASRYNSLLQAKIDERLSEVNEQAEHIVKAQLDGFSDEKDALLAELTELRQEELKILQSIERSARELLSDKVQEFIREAVKRADDNMASFHDQIESMEAAATQTVHEYRQGESLPDLETIRQSVKNERNRLEEWQKDFQDQLDQKTNSCMDAMLEYFLGLKSKIEDGSEQHIDYMVQSFNKLAAQQSDELDKILKAYSEKQQSECEQMCRHGFIDFLEKFPATFAESCEKTTRLQADLHSTTVSNIAMEYKAGITAIAKETDDQLQIVRAQLQSQLRSCQETYFEQSAKLLSKFERSVKELSLEISSGAPGNEKLSESFSHLFSEIKKELRDSSKSKTSLAETLIEQSFEKCRAQLASINQDISELVDECFINAKQQLLETTEHSKNKLSELSEKLNSLELLLQAGEMISALDQASQQI
jgi:DNA anti-recombination protein RmuC